MKDSYPIVILKAGREFPLLAGHPWIFSQGVERAEPAGSGNVVEIRSHEGKCLGIGTYHPGNTIRIRVLSRKIESIDTDFFIQRFSKLYPQKKKFLPQDTDGFRLVHADADSLPGLIVDLYGGVAVFQIHTAGMEAFREYIIEALSCLAGVKAIVERSDVEARKQEGLNLIMPKVHKGNVPGLVHFREQGLEMLADVVEGQKTGFFLDQREARILVRRVAQGRRVWNLFSYTGAFGLAAAAGGAGEIHNVDCSSRALEISKQMFQINRISLDPDRFFFHEADVFDYLQNFQRGKSFLGPNLLICDPPAFAKSQKHLEKAREAYLQLNTLCLSLLHSGDLFLSSSCSGRISQEDFLTILRMSAGRAGKNCRILSILGQAFDHTRLIAFPEGTYLKTVLLEVC
ncbi:MAG: class I SAM-dependent rRNA methyltransferase [Spirochaetales bacterium]